MTALPDFLYKTLVYQIQLPAGPVAPTHLRGHSNPAIAHSYIRFFYFSVPRSYDPAKSEFTHHPPSNGVAHVPCCSHSPCTFPKDVFIYALRPWGMPSATIQMIIGRKFASDFVLLLCSFSVRLRHPSSPATLFCFPVAANLSLDGTK